MGSIGVGGHNPNGADNQGSVLLKSFLRRPEVQVVAVCDVDARHREQATRFVEEHYGKASSGGVYKGCGAEWTYADGVKLIGEEQGRDVVCVTCEGTEGGIHIGAQLEAEPKSLLTSVIGPDEIHLPDISDHHGNFLDCVKSRETPLAPIEEAHRSATICHIGNIATKLQRKLRWNPETEACVDDAEANRMLARPMRSHYTLKNIA